MTPPVLNFVGIGAARCGSTWLCKCLQEIPEIFIPDRKELHLFHKDANFEASEVLNADGRAVLQEFYPSLKKGIKAGEFTPRYMLKEKALRRINVNFPDAKILVLLRDPVDRAFSQYNFFRNNKGKESDSIFEQALTGKNREDYIDKSCYSMQIAQVLKTFPSDQILFTIYEELFNNPLAGIGKICGFLGVNQVPQPSALYTVVNASLAVDKRVADDISDRKKLLQQVRVTEKRANHQLDPELKIRLFERYFKEDVERTETLLGRDLTHWNPALTSNRTDSE